MIIEIMSGILAFICFHQFGISFMMIFSFILSMILLCISVIDIDTMIIYGRFILCCLICSIISLWFDQNFIDKMIGFFIASVPMLVLNLFKDYTFNHKVEVEKGILKEECESLLKDFFKMLRKIKK